MYFQHAERIIDAGSEEKRMYIILEGAVEITLSDGENKIFVALLKKNDFFGELSLFNNSARTANATAKGDVKLTYIESYEQLKSFLMKNPAFAAKMVQDLTKRLTKTNELLMGKVSEVNRLKLTRQL